MQPGNDHQAGCGRADAHDGGVDGEDGGVGGEDGNVVWRNCRLAASASKDRRVGELELVSSNQP